MTQRNGPAPPRAQSTPATAPLDRPTATQRRYLERLAGVGLRGDGIVTRDVMRCCERAGWVTRHKTRRKAVPTVALTAAGRQVLAGGEARG